MKFYVSESSAGKTNFDKLFHAKCIMLYKDFIKLFTASKNNKSNSNRALHLGHRRNFKFLLGWAEFVFQIII